MVKPEQPREEDGQLHESKCPCNECETWAWALLDWEDQERKEGITKSEYASKMGLTEEAVDNWEEPHDRNS